MDEPKRPPLPDELQQLLGIDARPATPSTGPQLPAPRQEDNSEDTPVKLDRKQKTLITLVVVGSIFIAGLGFIGSYSAVSALAAREHFGSFSGKFPIGVDVGIGVFLALDLVLAGLRMPYPLLRPSAWFLTAATILFNASASGDLLGAGMHAVIPLQFVVVIEAGRHAVVRIADLKAHKFIESPPFMRWILSPLPTFRIWRRMRLWQLTSYTEVIVLERERQIFRTRMRRQYGRLWRSKATDSEYLAWLLARYGTPVQETLADHQNAVQDTPVDRIVELPGPDRTAVVDRPEVTSGPQRTADMDRADAAVHADRTVLQARTEPGPDRAEKPTRTKRTARADRTETAARTTGPDRSTEGLVLTDIEQEAIDRLRSTDRSISKRSIADTVRNELGQSIGSDRAAEIARHFRTLKAA